MWSFSATRRPMSRIARYGLAVASVTALLLVALVLHLSALRGPLFLPAVLLSAWYGGIAVGLFAAALSVLAIDYFLLPPVYGLWPESVDDAVYLVGYAVSAAFVAWATGRQRRSDEALRQQASLLDLTHDSISVRDRNDVITYWSRGAAERYGWSSAEAVGQVSHQLMRTVFPARLADIEAELHRTGRWEGELIHTKRDGAQVAVASRWSLRRDEQGRPAGVLETNNDITERKRADEALRRQANLLEQSHDAIIVWEFSGAIIYWSRGAEQLYGYSREEAIGRLSHDLLRTQHPVPTQLFETIIERHGKWIGEVAHLTRDGRTVIVDSRYVLMHETDGRRLVLETNRDITERKQAEYLTQQVFESSPDGVAIIGRDYRFQRVNPIYQRRTGIPVGRFVGMHLADVMSTKVFERAMKPDLDRCLAGEDVAYSGWFGDATSGRLYLAISYSPLRPHTQEVDAVLMISRDLTEHVRASEALQQAQAELAHVTRLTMLGEITASIAHEVNQPLAAVVMNGNACRRWLAADPPDLDEARDAAQRVVSDGERAARVIERVRTLLRRETLEKSALDVNDVIRETLAFTRGELERHQVSARAELRDDLPPVVGDRVQLQQVLVNLILNASDAMAGVDGGERLLTISSRREDVGGVVVEVADCGRGLGPGQQERIFDAFFSTKPRGLGMGLSISRSIVETHGGKIWATPNDGPGATMHFTLPAMAGGA
jgi:PAS domain S-box-containing protein